MRLRIDSKEGYGCFIAEVETWHLQVIIIYLRVSLAAQLLIRINEFEVGVLKGHDPVNFVGVTQVLRILVLLKELGQLCLHVDEVVQLSLDVLMVKDLLAGLGDFSHEWHRDL